MVTSQPIIQQRPQAGEFAPFYANYINLIKGDPLRAMDAQVLDIQALLAEVPEDKEEYQYAEGKWTIKEVIGHVSDAERVFAYRALSFSRGEQQSLPGFDENEYVPLGEFNRRSLRDLGREFGNVRESTIALFRSMSEAQLLRTGIANGQPISVRALAYIIAGHTQHHANILRSRYLIDITD